MVSVLSFALGYAALGWHVLPIRPNDKTPAGWLVPRGMLDATTDESKIRSWFPGEPRLNIAIACHPSGLVVVDVDPRNGGAASMRALRDAHGRLPRTTVCCTGGGGWHAYFRDPGVPLRATLAAGVDLKTDGYVVAPPSIHSSGKPYAFAPESTPSRVPLATMPDWLLSLARRPTYTSPPPAPAAQAGELRAEAYVDTMPPAISGAGGHSATFAVARKLVQDFGLADGAAWNILLRYNARCEPPWSEAQLRHKLVQARRARVSNPVENRKRT